MQLRFKTSGHKEKKILEPIKEESVTICSSGGVLELSISIDCALDIKPLEESPAVWTLDLPGNRLIILLRQSMRAPKACYQNI